MDHPLQPGCWTEVCIVSRGFGGVIAFAMTLLALDLRPPSLERFIRNVRLWNTLIVLSPRASDLLMTSRHWHLLGRQQTHHDRLSRSDRGYAWLQIAFLMTVSLIPFSTALLAEFMDSIALLVYWFNRSSASHCSRAIGAHNPSAFSRKTRRRRPGALLRRIYVQTSVGRRCV